MFGHNILAAPIVDPLYTEEKVIREDAMTGWDRKNVGEENARYGVPDWNASKTVYKYLPKGATWYDFWTGQLFKGGQTVPIQSSFDRVPMFVRAGSILPLGPEMQYVGEKSWKNLELRVYPGANGAFSLYEDEGDNYNYEKGVYTLIPMTWNDKTQTLTIGQRQGQYPGMLSQRTFTIVLPNGKVQTVDYNGQEISVGM